MNTEELVLRDGRFIHRQTSITETNIGDASELLSKHIPKGVTSLGHVGVVKWDDIQLSAHLLINGPKFLCYTILNSLKVSLCYRPVFKSEYQNAYADNDKTLAKDIVSKIHGWQFTGEATPNYFLGRKIKLDIPWDETKWGRLIFGIDGGTPSRMLNTMSFSNPPSIVQAYLGALKNGEIYTIRLTNHFDHGKVCMGDRWDQTKNQGHYLTCLQHALDSYLSAANNSDLWDESYKSLWALKPDAVTPYWANQELGWPVELGRPRTDGILRSGATSITSFMGIT